MKLPIESNNINPDDHFRYYLCQKIDNNEWNCNQINFDESLKQQNTTRKVIAIHKLFPKYLDKYQVPFIIRHTV
jgi:hypothetical protein